MSEETIQVPAGLTTEGLLVRRYVARTIDSVVLLLLIVAAAGVGGAILGVGAGLARSFPASHVTSASTFLLFLALFLIVWIGYGSLLESSRWQATLGKRLAGLRVYNAAGGRLTLSQAAGRNLVKDGPFLLFGLVPGGQLLTFVWLGAHLVVLHRSPVNQAIHDRAAHTWVAAPEETIQLRLT
jgi:uncharacterized RDD family membrane protein YckC